MHRGQVRADREERVRTLLRAKAPRDLLAHLAHAQRLLGQVVGKGHARICHEAPNVIAVLAQPPEQVVCLALFVPALLAPGCAVRGDVGVMALPSSTLPNKKVVGGSIKSSTWASETKNSVVARL